jgi:hypothetical protein
MQNMLNLRRVSSSLKSNITFPSWATERRRAIESAAHDVRVDSCHIDDVAQQDMRGRIMSASELMAYVGTALTNRASNFVLRAGYLHTGMRRRLPGRRAIRIRCSWHDDGRARTSVELGHDDSQISAVYSRDISQLTLDVDERIPDWRFWLVWMMAVMRMAAFRAVPHNYTVGYWFTPSPAIKREVMAIVRRRFPQARELQT